MVNADVYWLGDTSIWSLPWSPLLATAFLTSSTSTQVDCPTTYDIRYMLSSYSALGSSLRAELRLHTVVPPGHTACCRAVRYHGTRATKRGVAMCAVGTHVCKRGMSHATLG